MPESRAGKDAAEKDHPDTAASSRRRHRPREETRLMLLDAAMKIAVEHTADPVSRSSNVLASVRIKDVLTEVNKEGSLGGGPRLTTGAFYQIWDDQETFQRELLTHVMNQIATPGSTEIEALAFEMVSNGEPAAEVFRGISDTDFRISRQSPEMFLALGLGAIAPVALVQQAQSEANERYVDSMKDLLSNLIKYAGRRLLPGRTIEDLIWATEALMVGYLLRSRSHPDVPERTDEQGITARTTAYLGVVYAFTETVEPVEPVKENE